MRAVAVLDPAAVGEVVPTLAECEDVIERGQRTFIEVGLALKAIREHRLYRESHRTFETYCQERWGFTRQRAAQLIQAVALSTAVDIENEWQARRLHAVEEGTSSEVVTADEWRALLGVMEAIESLSSTVDATRVAAAIPQRRCAATAKRLRKLGTYLGRIAWLVEGNEVSS